MAVIANSRDSGVFVVVLNTNGDAYDSFTGYGVAVQRGDYGYGMCVSGEDGAVGSCPGRRQCSGHGLCYDGYGMMPRSAARARKAGGRRLFGAPLSRGPKLVQLSHRGQPRA